MAKPTLFVQQRNGDAVHFWFDHNRNLLVGQQSCNSLVKISYLIFGVGVVEAEHGREVLDLRERLEWFSADALSRRIRNEKIRKLRLQIDKFPVEAVVFAVTDDRLGLFIIKPVVLPNFIAQLLESFCSLRFVFGHETRYKRAKSRQFLQGDSLCSPEPEFACYLF